MYNRHVVGASIVAVVTLDLLHHKEAAVAAIATVKSRQSIYAVTPLRNSFIIGKIQQSPDVSR